MTLYSDPRYLPAPEPATLVSWDSVLPVLDSRDQWRPASLSRRRPCVSVRLRKALVQLGETLGVGAGVGRHLHIGAVRSRQSFQ